jgi:hypothetical protein
MAFEFVGGAIVQGIVTSMAVKGVSNVVQGKDLFSDMGQSMLMGGLTGGIFGGLGSGSSFGFENLFGSGAPATVGSATSGVPSANIDALGNTRATSNLAINSGNAAVETAKNFGNNLPVGMSNPYGLTSVANNYNLAPHSIYGGSSSLAVPTPEVYLGDQQFLSDPEAAMQARQYGAMQQTQGLISMPPAPGAVTPATVESSPRTTDMPVQPANYLGGYAKPSSSFMDDSLKWAKDNPKTAMLGGLGIAGAMGAFNRNTGLKNLPPRAYQRVNTSYNPGTVNPKYGMPGEPYFVGQGYGPETRETFYGAAGGGIRALSGGGETAPYVPMTARGQMTIKENVPDDLDDSAAFKRYLKSDINKKEEKGQAEIDKNVSSWLERYAKADVKGMAEGGPAQQVTPFQPTFSTAPQGIGSLPYQAPNVPAMQSSPTDYNQSPQYAPTQQYGASATSYSAPAANPMTAGLGSYLQGLEYKAPVTPAPTTSTTSPAGYNPATQTYGTNPATPTTALPITPKTRLVPQGEDEPDKTQYLQPNGSYSDLSPALTGVTTRMVPQGEDEGSRMEYQLPDESWSSLHPALVGLNTRQVQQGEDEPDRTEYQSPDGNWSSAENFDYGSQNSKPPVTIYDPSTQRYIPKPVSPLPDEVYTQPISPNEFYTQPASPPASTSNPSSVNTRQVQQGEDEPDRTEYQSPDGSWSSVNPNPPVFDPFAINYDSGGGDKAGGPIKSRRYAMGGLAALPEYAAGGKLLSGDGDGMSDSIPAVIKGARPQRAALADGEFVIPADVVSHLGNGSTKAGGKRLYEMMANIRKARTGNSKQGKQINPMKFMPT